MKALVTGATGFVGSHLVAALRRRGDDVTILLRSPGKAAILQDHDLHTIQGSLFDVDALALAVQGQDVIYHVAGLTAARDEAEFVRVNREGTARLQEAAALAGSPRFVLVSSLAAAGPTEPGRPLTGPETPRPVTAYGRSKLAAEEVVRAGPLPWTIIRPPTVYGPRDTEVLKLFRIARYGFAPVFGGGTQHISLIYGPDLAEALAAAGHAGAEGIFYASHPDIVTSGDFVREVAAAMSRTVRVIPVPEPIGRALLHVTGGMARLAGRATILNPDKANEFFQPAWTCDPAALTATTGWQARHGHAEGLRSTFEWYRGEGWL